MIPLNFGLSTIVGLILSTIGSIWLWKGFSQKNGSMGLLGLAILILSFSPKSLSFWLIAGSIGMLSYLLKN